MPEVNISGNSMARECVYAFKVRQMLLGHTYIIKLVIVIKPQNMKFIIPCFYDFISKYLPSDVLHILVLYLFLNENPLKREVVS